MDILCGIAAWIDKVQADEAGQPTDESEMAMLLARVLADQGRYDPEEARKAYISWLGRDRIYSRT